VNRSLVLLSSCAVAVAAASGAIAACSSSSTAASAVDAGAEAAAETVAYPAVPVDAPQIAKNDGVVLHSPMIVTVTWPGDTTAASWEAFGDGLGATPFWAATTMEYGVGPVGSNANLHVRMNAPLPATLSYTDLQNFVAAQLTGGGAGGVDAGAADGGDADGGASEGGAVAQNPVWPTPALDGNGMSQSIYALYIPSTTAVTDPGSGQSFCNEGGFGYHDNVVVNGHPVAYSVTLECTSQTAADLQETAAHEAVEAATNPFPSSSTKGYAGFDSEHLAWDLYSGYNDELADACQNWQESYIQLTGAFPYWVQRSWSNGSAAAGHDPCVPAPTTPYHTMTLLPSEESDVTVNLSTIGKPKATAKGFPVTVGQPLTFHVAFVSDAPADPWTIKYDFPSELNVFDTSFNPVSNGKATVSLDKTSGQNGDVVTVTVTPTTKGKAGFQMMAITWDPPGAKSSYLPHYLPILLVDQ
jgi:hypothetical protein